MIERTVKYTCRTCKLFFHLIQNKRVLFPTRNTVVWFTFGFTCKEGYHCDVKHQLPFALFMKEDKTTSIILYSNCFEKKKTSFHLMFLCLKHFFNKYDMLFLYFFLKKSIKRLSMIFLPWPLAIMSFWLPKVNFLFLSDIKASRRIV